jgi:hypothetical protein
MDAIKKKEAANLLTHNRDRRFSDVGLNPEFSNPKSGRRHSDLTAYYYQYQLGTHQPYNNQQMYLPRPYPTFAQPAVLPTQNLQSGFKKLAISSDSSSFKKSFETTSNPVHHITHAVQKVEQKDNLVTLEQKEKVQLTENDSLAVVNTEKSLEDWTDGDNEAVLENEEWCSFLDSQLEECIRHDMQVSKSLPVLSLKHCVKITFLS